MMQKPAPHFWSCSGIGSSHNVSVAEYGQEACGNMGERRITRSEWGC